MKQYIISINDANQRLDKFLKKLLPSASLGYIYKLLRKWNIKIITLSQLSLNSLPLQEKEAAKIKWTKQDKEYKLKVWEQVQIFLSDSDIEVLQKQETQTHSIKTEQKLSQKDIVFEDDSLLVLNKCAWINVHPGDHKSEEVSLIEQVHDYYGWKLNSFTFKPSLIHRIDRDTSGIIMIAKSKQTLTKLSHDFKKHDALRKTYFCIVLWKLSRKSWTIKKNVLRIENAKNENKVQVSEKGLEAISHYKLLDEYNLILPEWKQTLSSVEVTIETGRMHQIRDAPCLENTVFSSWKKEKNISWGQA